MRIRIDPLDVVIIVAYLALIVGLGLWAWRRRRHGPEGGGEYFLAGRSLTWPIIGLALFSTNISTIHLVSLAQEGYVNGLAYGNFEWMAAFTLIALSLFFAPFYIRSRVATLPDFLEKRYSRPCRDWLAVLSIVSAIFIHIGFSLYTGAVVLEGMFGIGKLESIVVTSAVTGLYTIVGGLLAVVVTESVQTVILLAGAVAITAIGYWNAGGWEGIRGSVDPVKLTILRGADLSPTLPWYSVLLGYPVIGLWYWCADQTIVQRVLGARDENHARIGPLFAGFIKILPVFIFVLPGTIGLALVHQGKMSAPEKSEAVYATLIAQLLPAGLKGLVAIALLAALMSTVSGARNSIATLFCYDLYRRWRPASTDRQLVVLGRWVTFVAMLVAMVWSVQVGNIDESIFQGITKVITCIAPPITAVFVWGVFWRRASAAGAFATLVIGSLLGLAVFVADATKLVPWLEGRGWTIPYALKPDMLKTFYLFVACSVVLVVVSIARPHVHTEESARLVWDRPLDALRSAGWRGPADYRVVAAVLFAIMVALYSAFA